MRGDLLGRRVIVTSTDANFVGKALFPRSPQETQHAILVRALLLTLEDV